MHLYRSVPSSHEETWVVAVLLVVMVLLVERYLVADLAMVVVVVVVPVVVAVENYSRDYWYSCSRHRLPRLLLLLLVLELVPIRGMVVAVVVAHR